MDRFYRIFELARYLSQCRRSHKTDELIRFYTDHSTTFDHRRRLLQRDLKVLRDLGLVVQEKTGGRNLRAYRWVAPYRWEKINAN